MLRHLAVVLIAMLGTPAAAQAQTAPPPVLTLDQERLFQNSTEAGRISAEIEKRAGELSTENRRIEAELTAEEEELTLARETLDPEEFRALANAFDQKVQRIRLEQDSKERELQRLRDEERQNFLNRITPVLAEIAGERGALMVLDRRVVLLSADAIDITDAVIARIDARPQGPEVPPIVIVPDEAPSADDAVEPDEDGTDGDADPAPAE